MSGDSFCKKYRLGFHECIFCREVRLKLLNFCKLSPQHYVSDFFYVRVDFCGRVNVNRPERH